MPSIAYFFPGLDDVGQAAVCAGVEAGVLPCPGASWWVWGGCAPTPRSWSWSLPPSAPPQHGFSGEALGKQGRALLVVQASRGGPAASDLPAAASAGEGRMEPLSGVWPGTKALL